jgi:hypothetical protein
MTWRVEQGKVYSDGVHTNNLELCRLDGKQYRVKKFSIQRGERVQTIDSVKIRVQGLGITLIRYRFQDSELSSETLSAVTGCIVYRTTLSLEVDAEEDEDDNEDEEFVCEYPISYNWDYTDDDCYSDADSV